jgi:hypothetical protein
MKNYPCNVDPLILCKMSANEIPPYFVNQLTGFRAQGHSYMDMAHHKALTPTELLRMRCEFPEQFAAADEIAQEKVRRDLVPYYHAMKAQLDRADLELKNRDMSKMTDTQLIKYRTDLFNQLKAAHWTEIEPDKEVKCELNLNDVEHLMQHGKPNVTARIPYSSVETKPWIESKQYAALLALKETKAEREAAAKVVTTKSFEAPTEAPVVHAQHKPLPSEIPPTPSATAQENARPPEPEQVPAETDRLNKNTGALFGVEYALRHRGIDRMACGREEAIRIAAAHPWL